MKTSVKYVEIDLKRIFTTPPNTRKEKIILFSMMLIVFILFFGPLCFTNVPPWRAVAVSCFPALSVSWGWVVLLRGLFRKEEYSMFKKNHQSACRRFSETKAESKAESQTRHPWQTH